MPSTVLHAEDFASQKTSRFPALMELTLEERDDKQINECTIPELWKITGLIVMGGGGAVFDLGGSGRLL